MQPKFEWKSTVVLFLAGLFLFGSSDLGKPVSPSPVSLTGVRGIEWYDSSKGMPPVFISSEVRSFWDSHAVKDPKSQMPEHRVFDITIQKSDLANETEGMKQYFEVKPNTVPGVVLGDGKKGYNGPVPNTGNLGKDISDYLQLLQKYVPTR